MVPMIPARDFWEFIPYKGQLEITMDRWLEPYFPRTKTREMGALLNITFG